MYCSKQHLEERRAARRRRLDQEVERLVARLAQRSDVRKVILFGSLANGDVGLHSDVDLVIVADTEKPFLDRLEEFLTYLDATVALDVLVYTPLEWQRLKTERAFIRRIAREGRILYEAVA